MVGVTPAAVAARAVTQTVPIVCPLLADPIHLGLIASESRPGGNVTGLSFRIDGLVGKQLELALLPNAGRIGFLVNIAIASGTMSGPGAARMTTLGDPTAWLGM